MLTRNHAILPPTHAFIHKWNESYLPLLPTHSITALQLVLIFRPAEGRRLSWPVAGYKLMWLPTPSHYSPGPVIYYIKYNQFCQCGVYFQEGKYFQNMYAYTLCVQITCIPCDILFRIYVGADFVLLQFLYLDDETWINLLIDAHIGRGVIEIFMMQCLYYLLTLQGCA